MIRFIWQNWWRRKERFILLIIGAFIVSAGLTYLIGLSETNKGTIVDTLQKRWTASYDIVVRPEGTRSVTEDKKLLEPNYLSGLSGGISLEQYETIKAIPGIEVAAPIAMLGYTSYSVNYGQVKLSEPGIYRRIMKTTVNNGIGEETEIRNYYFPINVWDLRNKGSEYGVAAPYLDWLVDGQSLLAGIDPEQEAKLVGLDEAIMELGTSRYFVDSDTYYFDEDKGYHEIPIIVNQTAYVDKLEQITFEKLDIEINEENADAVMNKVRENGGEDYLDTLSGEVVDTFSVTGKETFHAFINRMTGVDWETGEVIVLEENEEEKSEVEDPLEITSHVDEDVSGIVFKPSPLVYQEISSPYADRWPYTYQVVPFQNSDDAVGVYKNKDTFREPILIAENYLDLPRMKPNWIGFYEASNLAISMDPTSELPMETYRPASAEYVMDVGGNPINPPKQLMPTGDPYSFLTDPPGMLTTIEAAANILGEKPISAIRIKVAGVADLSDESQAILEQVASEIENRTGLITDITLGSSPQLALSYVPGLNGGEDIGWLQQPWVNIGSSISIFKETKIGFSGVVGSVIAVAIVYVWASGIVNLLARRKEFAVLLSVGWRPRQLSRLLFLESSIIGIFVAVTSWMMLGFVYISSDATISFNRFLWTGLFGFIVYVFGSFIPMLLTRNISPYEAMRTGEISVNSKRIFQTKGINRMAFNHFIGKWKRSFLSVISISLPTALLAVFLYITFRLRGIMYTSLLGEYVALEIGPAHYVAILVSLVIAILTTAEIMWQNVSERREEISLLQAIGWKRWSIRRLILAEGVFSGLFAALIGLSLAFLIMWGLYGAFPTEEIGFILATGLIPVVIGIIGTIFPAERAVRMTPNQGMGGNITNRKAVEKRLKWVVISTSVLLVGTFLMTMIKVAPNIEQAKEASEFEHAFNPTEGEVSVTEPKDTGDQNENEDDADDEINLIGVDDYLFAFNSSQTSEDVGWGGQFFYAAKEVESTLAISESGMKPVAIEFTFEVRDTDYDIQPKRNFTLINGEESYSPEKVTILEVEGWENEEWLLEREDGKMRAVLEFIVPEEIENYGLVLKNSTLGYGVLIRFEE
ncbi:ABC transporter permease [Ornithinibacillus californiensis]|uniref:ABC transporter permease n=1 Tax=Ornithinibacillus californiensis TaxID=161536 RepID=UPI00069FC006|nr:ABC transporter permease [Ornithinibacillus californiensis]